MSCIVRKRCTIQKHSDLCGDEAPFAHAQKSVLYFVSLLHDTSGFPQVSVAPTEVSDALAARVQSQCFAVRAVGNDGKRGLKIML